MHYNFLCEELEECFYFRFPELICNNLRLLNQMLKRGELRKQILINENFFIQVIQ